MTLLDDFGWKRKAAKMLGVPVQLKHAPEVALNEEHHVTRDRPATHPVAEIPYRVSHCVPKPACEMNFKKMCRVLMVLI